MAPRSPRKRKKQKVQRRRGAAPYPPRDKHGRDLREPIVPEPIPPPALAKHLTTLPERVQGALLQCSLGHRKFVEAYVGVARGNGTYAAKLAGLGGKGADYMRRAVMASQVLRLAHVRAAIDLWMDAVSVNAAQLTFAIADIAQANLGPFVEWGKDGTLTVKVPSEDTWEAHKHWIKSLKTDPETGKVIEIELHDAAAARRDLAKILKLHSDAPIFALYLQAQSMTDSALIAEIAELSKKVRGGEKERLQLNPGDEIAAEVEVHSAGPTTVTEDEDHG